MSPARLRPLAAARLASCRRGATTIEYGLILAFIFITISGALMAMGGTVQGMWNDMAARVERTR